jgi:hypothetical protein
MKHETIADQFTRYINMVYKNPPEKGSLQYTELRRAFYAAWGAALGHTGRVAVGLSENEACLRMQRWTDECKGFGDTVGEKKA